jgi:type 1 fimbriae regulatory protein FimB
LLCHLPFKVLRRPKIFSWASAHKRTRRADFLNAVDAELRPREYLTAREVEALIQAARKHGRYGHRDATAILLAYRHGLRASELIELSWDMIELDSGRIHVRRAKNGTNSTHPLTGKKIRALRQLRREVTGTNKGKVSCSR